MTPQHIILAVEDERNLRELMEEILTDAGFEVLTAANALAAFEIIQSDIHIDAIVTDIAMPGAADGRELARFIRNTRPHIHIVVLAGAPLDPADPLLKHVHYLQKPLGLMQLASTLSIILGENRVTAVNRTFIEAISYPLSNTSLPIQLRSTSRPLIPHSTVVPSMRPGPSKLNGVVERPLADGNAFPTEGGAVL